MDLLLFYFFFGSIIFLIMPVYALSYKVFEKKFKRSLYGKASQQISYFIALFALLYFVALGLDIFMKGTLYQLNVLIMGFVPNINAQNIFYAILGMFFLLALFSFGYATKVKNLVLPIISTCCGFVGMYFLFTWLSFLTLPLDYTQVLNNTQFFPTYFNKILFGIEYHFISAKNYDVVFQVLLSGIFYSFVFLFALYVIILCTIIIRNKMDFGRDYYVFVFQRYGKTLFFITFILMIFLALMTVLFEPSLQTNIANNLVPFFAKNVFYAQIAIAIIPFICLLISMKWKKSFYSAQSPMQKKSLIFLSFLLDMALMFGYFSVLVYA